MSLAQGFTLIEVLTSSLVVSTVLALSLTALSLQRTSVSRGETQARLREQATFALQVMSQRVRMAGYGVGYSLAGSQTLEGVGALWGCDGCGFYDASRDGSGATTGSDQLIVLYRNPETEFNLATALYQADPAPCGTTTLLSDAGGPRRALLAGTVVTCQDDGQLAPLPHAFAWTLREAVLTGSPSLLEAPAGEALLLLPNTGSAFAAACQGTLPVLLRCGGLQGSALAFYLEQGVLFMDDDGDRISRLEDGSLSLSPTNSGMSDDIPLARNVEDFQVAFCLPDLEIASGDCLLQSDSERWLAPSSLSEQALGQVRAVRITVVTREEAITPSQAMAPLPVENHRPSQAGASDGFMRLVSSIVVPVPNLGYVSSPLEEEQP